jgi:hypothetical protein
LKLYQDVAVTEATQQTQTFYYPVTDSLNQEKKEMEKKNKIKKEEEIKKEKEKEKEIKKEKEKEIKKEKEKTGTGSREEEVRGRNPEHDLGRQDETSPDAGTEIPPLIDYLMRFYKLIIAYVNNKKTLT